MSNYSPERRTPHSTPPGMPISIPGRNRSESPVRLRRTESPTDDRDQGLSGSTTRPRLSPTLGRSFSSNDPESRERQRTLDVDMAIHLSRARQNSVSASPVISPFHSIPSAHPHNEHPSLAATHLPSFSEGEEREFENARAGGASSAPPTVDGELDMDGDKSDFEFPSPMAADLPTDLRMAGTDNADVRDTDLLYASAAAGPNIPEVPIAGREPFLPPLYQAAYGSGFDFDQMEVYAREEKRRLGLDTPSSPPPALRWLDATTSNSRRGGGGDGGATTTNGTAGPSSSRPALDPEVADNASVAGTDNGDALAPGPSSRIRHRKISQSKAVPRVARGPGKKTALFEGAAGAPPPSLLPGGTALPPSSALSSFENIFGGRTGMAPGTPSGGGHDRPYRFSFYSNALSATIHARSLAELPAEGQTFEQLFQGLQSGADASFGQEPVLSSAHPTHHTTSVVGSAVGTPAQQSAMQAAQASRRVSAIQRPAFAPGAGGMPEPAPGYMGSTSKGALALQGGPHVDVNTWWLDVLNPTDEEMKMLSKVFGIHPLTTEDILMEETREKIELFRNYYLVCFRGFDQDPYSPTHLEPLNMYIIVFREGTLSFHFRATPHPQNVRRRIKQLKDYISVTSDWISYALIDDITDAFGPLIQGIEYEVDSIDELVLILKEAEQSDMLRRIGTCRKKVMGLLRLVGNKADVVKGLAKRCNENWRVAPTSDIGLYLSDIQDHLITMTQNLNHYEKILSRSHSNYLAQISIEMTEANNQINDVLSKMTALGTVLIPMNLVTGLWGMNVHVPGEGVEGYTWFASILGGLIVFAAAGGWMTFRLMSAR